MSTEFKTDGGLHGDPPLPPASGSASALLMEWRKACQERDKAICDRVDNMFHGPIGIEEHLVLLRQDNQMNAWFLNKLIGIVAEIEPKMPNARTKPRR